jgi:hypothetical protein
MGQMSQCRKGRTQLYARVRSMTLALTGNHNSLRRQNQEDHDHGKFHRNDE